ncbi:MAG TPA: 16S rRNA (cytosine(967)-C(5))-methyltransferase RsmB [Gemmataceae bacterium]|nr:16S rRNA (cytosine(967)-C(5))-methyltransferase RsmB [Gemmataceae bacterium]
MNRPSPPFRGAAHNARSLALQILLDCRKHDAFVQEILDRQFAATAGSRRPLAEADRRLVTQLVYGVLRRRGTLRALLEPLVNRPAHKVESWLWDALALGACQLALLTHIPAHAAVHETVELAVDFGRPGARGFLNGVLRQVAALVTDERMTTAAANALPLEHGAYRRLARPVLPDPATHPLEYVAAAFGLPDWLVRRWLPRYGVEECQRLGFWFAGPAPLMLRCNPLRIEREALLTALREAGHTAEAGEHSQALRLHDAGPIRDLPGYAKGWFSVQDESAMRVATALMPEPGESVLDLCAAPGGKTTHLAELMRNTGRILACDVEDRRLQTVNTLAQRLGLTIIETHRLQGEEAPPGLFDRVLVDVPCSNTGVLGKRPEARWRLRPDDLRHLVTLQTRLLRLAIKRVRPGGTIVYSTCSIEPEENRQVVEAVLRESPDLRLEADEEATPGQPADGGYWARLQRKSC